LYRQNPPWGKARRSAGRAADPIRVRDQPEDREGTRNYGPADAAGAGGCGDSVAERMDRRTFIGAVAAAMMAAPLAASAQNTTTVRRIGQLWSGLPEAPDDREKFAVPLRALGWVEGRNLLIERRTTERAELLVPLAEELVRLKVEIIVAWGTDAVLAA